MRSHAHKKQEEFSVLKENCAWHARPNEERRWKVNFYPTHFPTCSEWVSLDMTQIRRNHQNKAEKADILHPLIAA